MVPNEAVAPGHLALGIRQAWLASPELGALVLIFAGRSLDGTPVAPNPTEPISSEQQLAADAGFYHRCAALLQHQVSQVGPTRPRRQTIQSNI